MQKPNRLFQAAAKWAYFGTTDEAKIREGCRKLKRVEAAHDLAATRDREYRRVLGDPRRPVCNVLGWNDRDMAGETARGRYLDLVFPDRR
jgi:hypothetical protein